MTQSDPPGHFAATARGSCPICGRPTDADYRPFCSRRCADVDLARWLRGAYVIPDRTGEEAAGGAAAQGCDEECSGSRH